MEERQVVMEDKEEVEGSRGSRGSKSVIMERFPCKN
jgi:hypothetical protein